MAKAGNHGIIIPRDKALMRRLYWKDNHSLPEIGMMYGVTHKSVERVFRELGIPRRKVGHSRNTKCKCGKPVLKIRHATNGSHYGKHCLKCRRAHYAMLAREYAKNPEVKKRLKAALRRWYLYGAKNPTGELQWLNKSKIMLRNTRRLLLRPHSPEASEFRNAVSELERSLRA